MEMTTTMSEETVEQTFDEFREEQGLTDEVIKALWISSTQINVWYDRYKDQLPYKSVKQLQAILNRID